MNIKIGEKIVIISMRGEPSYTGKTGVVTYIDSYGQLHGTWGGLAIIPEKDIFQVIHGESKNETIQNTGSYPFSRRKDG